ncbi:NAD(P)-binding domain-containing protein [Aquibacillus koreensis]|uniref:NAD(P)-binding domain-containing protein n=1 Tax=Aquibacillus koreensis TaxID=279446 RepID=UPI002341C496|nr:NAD(P)-binding domain-containing protein [Aquibacillus koreensis]
MKGDPNVFPTKDVLADYLVEYATQFELPFQCSTEVLSLGKLDDYIVLITNKGCLKTKQVVIATGHFRRLLFRLFQKICPQRIEMKVNYMVKGR